MKASDAARLVVSVRDDMRVRTTTALTVTSRTHNRCDDEHFIFMTSQLAASTGR